MLDLEQGVAEDARVVLGQGLGRGSHELRLTLAARASGPDVPVDLAFGGATVFQATPTSWPVTVLAGVGLIGLWYGVRELVYALAFGAKWLTRHRQLDLGPPLSRWQPRRRS